MQAVAQRPSSCASAASSRVRSRVVVARAGPLHRRNAAASTEASVRAPDSLEAVTSSSAVTSTSKCPFLAALPSPPESPTPWWGRLQQLLNPPIFQRQALSGGSSVVHFPSQMLMPEQYLVADADLAKQVMGGELDGTFTVATGALRGVGRLFGTHNMLAVPEPRHSYLRGLMQPAFSPEGVAASLPAVEVVVADWLKRWADADGPVKGSDAFKAMTFDFILQAVFNRNWSPEKVMQLSQEFRRYTLGVFAWPFLNIPFTPYARAIQAREALLKEFMAAVADARQQLAEGRDPGGILSILLQAEDEQGNRLTDVELEDNLLLLLLAGHDTSSSTLTLAMVNLQEHPEVVTRLVEEQQQQILAKHGPGFTAAVLKDMVYADAVVRETLRKDNIVSALGRKTTQDLDLGGYRVPEGSMVQVPFTYLSEHDPRWVNETGELDPAVFNPDRQLTKEGAKPGWVMPFGYGPRFCIGYNLALAEMKIFLALLARHYTAQVEVPSGPNAWSYAIGKVPSNGLPMTITRRDQPLAAAAP